MIWAKDRDPPLGVEQQLKSQEYAPPSKGSESGPSVRQGFERQHVAHLARVHQLG